jgi:nitrate/nitrite transporter NarK
MFTNSPTHITISLFRGWLVAVSATAMGLVLGILYIWSVIKAGIPDSWGWSNADKALPYSVMCIVFAIIMVPAGRFQDRYGPRWVVLLGGFLTGLGCIVSGLGGSSRLAYFIGFGLITGAGAGFAYSALTPAAMKWFPPQRTGSIVGIVVAGFGLSPLPLAPLTTWFLRFFSTTNSSGVIEKGVPGAMVGIGLVVWLIVGLLFWFIANPPDGFMAQVDRKSAPRNRGRESGSREMLVSAQFWLLFLMYFSGASAGLVFISVAADLGKHALGEWAFLAVVILSMGNTAGRILAGIVSDRIGRQWTLFGEFICQGAMIGLLFWLSRHGGGEWPAILSVLFMIGLNYGANLTIFPAACKDYFGIRNFGINYGFLFFAFGAAGLVMPWVNGLIKDKTGSLDLSYILIMIMMAVAALLSLASRHLASRQKLQEGSV